jgi:hypothetical protein
MINTVSKTINFLFTDIEGGARLWELNPGVVAAALREVIGSSISPVDQPVTNLMLASY